MSFYGDGKHTDKEDGITMNLYQLLDGDNEQAGLIYTNAPEKLVKKIWKAVVWNEMIDKQVYHLEDVEMEEEADTEKLCELLQYEGYNVERVWYTEINC